MGHVNTGLTSPYFRIEQLADGVYAALVREGSGALGNAGIVDLGDETLLFDTFLTPKAAQDLHVVAEHLTGHRIGYVVNSHWHRDHVYGNQIFTSGKIISSAKTREMISARGTDQLAAARRQMPDVIRELEAALEREHHEQKRRQIARELKDERAFQAALPDLVLTLPTLTFDKELTLYGSRRAVSLICPGVAHTEGDTYLRVHGEGIAFVGDLVVVHNHPWLGHGDPEGWLSVLDHLETLNLQQLVCGHGPIGTNGDIRLVREYIHGVVALVRGFIARGASREQTQATSVPDQWADWELQEVFGWNMRALYNSLSKGATGTGR